MSCPNKVYQCVQLELAVILTKVVVVSPPSLANQNFAVTHSAGEYDPLTCQASPQPLLLSSLFTINNDERSYKTVAQYTKEESCTSG